MRVCRVWYIHKVTRQCIAELDLSVTYLNVCGISTGISIRDESSRRV
jgi:hypothetical protein